MASTIGPYSLTCNSPSLILMEVMDIYLYNMSWLLLTDCNSLFKGKPNRRNQICFKCHPNWCSNATNDQAHSSFSISSSLLLYKQGSASYWFILPRAAVSAVRAHSQLAFLLLMLAHWNWVPFLLLWVIKARFSNTKMKEECLKLLSKMLLVSWFNKSHWKSKGNLEILLLKKSHLLGICIL